MIKRIISCIVSTVIVLGATIAYDRTPACRIAVMEQVPTQLASVLPRAASYELELRTEEGNRSYTVNCRCPPKFSYSFLNLRSLSQQVGFSVFAARRLYLALKF